MQFKYSFVDLFFLEKLACFVALNLKKCDSISLVGDLGVGKTTFVRFLVNALIPSEDVSSPTFSIINEYHSSEFIIYHVDLYRVSCLREVYDLGLDCICDNGVCIVEWPNLLDGILNFNLKVNINSSIRENLRDIEIIANDGDWCNALKKFK
ncbi:tRNA (adenosine(37)-N6)-threonylcarbamoyltransferase complex ATPase subunit type 1 TsaE [Ehrlichia minasensis]|uniref:tRNA threonylcarbamoyladenosine biosynthesis protein TsaE n=1 Tax=Ehrlichia minasensis TaxID=1242993 RepID=A0A4Q6I6N1_9RICK|nr:tRNA (adenosine(37)-N6)-threonylcarbamoyltransferase complex ATPase subunit type 1 TsaE [Ehrlichia minasensis]RZB12853.1 tRNA (adenosine(37)-N6)-threonylcarbamoyltransferase complex ATPase subunit type 1 TsaE [Ehrlichia minasensis]CEI85164.1 Uncharacterized protein ehr_00550 [Ehrlichia minasensis]